MSIKGPCVLCGATNYQLSYGGLTICPSCDCGIPPEVRELRDENAKLQNALSDFTLLMAVNKDLEAKLSLAEKALEKVDIYFKALSTQWDENNGRVVSESGRLINASSNCERLCDEAGSAVIDALSQIKQIRGKGC